MRIYFIFCLICVCTFTEAYSQKAVDSLEARILHFEQTGAFQTALDSLYAAWPLISTFPDTTQAKFHNYLGNSNSTLRNEDESLKNYTLATQKALPCSKQQVHGFIGQASIYRIKEQYNEALASLDNASACITDTNLKQFAQVALFTGATYLALSDYRQADQWLTRALRSAETSKAKNLVANSAYQLGESQKEQGNQERAIEFYELSLNSSDVDVTPWVVSYTLLAMGTAYLELDLPEKAILVLDSALSIAFKFEIVDDTCFVRATLALAHAKLGNHDAAIKLGERVIACTAEMVSEYSVHVRKALSISYEKQGNFEKALYYQKDAEKFEEQIRGTERTRALARNLAEMEFGQRERTLEKEQLIAIEREREATLEQENQRNLFIIGFGILVVIALSLWRIMQLRKKNSDLIKREKEFQENLLQNIVHEFRTPLTLIQGPVEQLITPDMPPEKLALAEIAKRNTERLLVLVNQLLDMAKVKAGQLKPQLQKTDLNLLFNDVLFSFLKTAEEKNIALNLHKSEVGISAETDPEMIHKVLSNLVSNALKFTPEKGTISVSIGSNQSGFQFSVADTGIGMNEEAQKRVFEKFYQVDSSITRRGEGTGIGLAYVQDILSLLNGKIELKSNLNQGSTFTISIPAKMSKISAHEKTKSAESIDQPTISLSNNTQIDDSTIVLLVEDNPDMRTYIDSLLSNQGLKVVQAINGIEALKKVEEQQPDFVLSDVMMPEMDGFELCHRLKSEEATAHIPVVLLTAKASQDSRNVGFERGADHYLGKPFNAQELILVIQNTLKQQKRVQQRYQTEVSTMDEKSLLQTDNQFLQRLIKNIEENLATENRSVDDLAAGVGLSRSQLHRRLKTETGMSATQFNNAVKMLFAKSLIQDQKMNVSEAAYAVGFSDASYFTKVFSEQFGVKPSEV